MFPDYDAGCCADVAFAEWSWPVSDESACGVEYIIDLSCPVLLGVSCSCGASSTHGGVLCSTCSISAALSKCSVPSVTGSASGGF